MTYRDPDVKALLSAAHRILDNLTRFDPVGLRGEGEPRAFAKHTDWTELRAAVEQLERNADTRET